MSHNEQPPTTIHQRLTSQLANQVEDWQIHRDHDAANHAAEEGDHDRLEQRQEAGDRDVLVTPHDKLKTKFDPAKWNRWELRFRGKKVTALLNGEVFGEEPLPDTRQGGGFVGIVVQDIKAAFRNIEVEKH